MPSPVDNSKFTFIDSFNRAAINATSPTYSENTNQWFETAGSGIVGNAAVGAIDFAAATSSDNIFIDLGFEIQELAYVMEAAAGKAIRLMVRHSGTGFLNVGDSFTEMRIKESSGFIELQVLNFEDGIATETIRPASQLGTSPIVAGTKIQIYLSIKDDNFTLKIEKEVFEFKSSFNKEATQLGFRASNASVGFVYDMRAR